MNLEFALLPQFRNPCLERTCDWATGCELLLPRLPQEERVGERRPFETPLSGSLPARVSRGEREPGFNRQFA